MKALLARSLLCTRLGLRSLARNKLRSGLTLLGVFFGVASVIVLLAVGEGARSEAVRQIEELGSRNIFLRSVKPVRESAEETEGGMFRYGLNTGDVRRIAAALPGVRLLPEREHQRDVRSGERVIQGRVVAVTEEYRELNDLHLEHGRFICELDRQRFVPVAVLGSEVASRLFPFENPVGRSIRIGTDQYYQVAGVLRRRSGSAGAGDALPAREYNHDVYIPLETDRARFGRFLTYHRSGELEKDGLEITQVTLVVESIEKVKSTAEVAEAVIRERHPPDEVAVVVPLSLLEKVEETQRLFKLVLGAIASISLIVGGIGIMNVMLATVSERTREIGTRRALGAKQRDIVGQFLLESVLLSASGGMLGITFGLALSYGLVVVLGLSAIVRPFTLLLSFGISVAVGLAFGTYPALRAARMHPVEALRHE